MNIGVLALQGDYGLHTKLLSENNIDSTLVTKPKQLNDIEGLIIPGGESTVILKLIKKYGFIEPLKKFSKIKSIFGTCAGAIVISNSTADNMHTLDFINVRTNRNFWGRQINSFSDNINLNLDISTFVGHFIRAPKFEVLSNEIQILGTYKDIPVLLRNDKHLISSFHPEMTDDFSIHDYFVGIVNA